MQKLIAKITVWLLKSKRLDGEARILLLNALLNNLSVLPIKDVITFTTDGILVKGKALTVEQAVQLRENAVSLKSNSAYSIIKEQMAYEAIKFGVHGAVTLDMLAFSKAALWLNEQETKIVEELSQDV
jgi:hypothetical protein